MKVARYVVDGREDLGVVIGDRIVSVSAAGIPYRSLEEVLEDPAQRPSRDDGV